MSLYWSPPAISQNVTCTKKNRTNIWKTGVVLADNIASQGFHATMHFQNAFGA